MEQVDIEISWGGKVYWAFPVHQDFSALFIVLTDMGVVLIYILFIYVLDAKQNRFADFYKDNRIQADDFTVQISNLPGKDSYLNDSDVLKQKLQRHIT